nr:TIGR01440 family protein [Salipaludibacillus agaradhaerens]
MSELNTNEMSKSLTQALEEFQSEAHLQKDQLFIIGASTSEVLGERIGSSGTIEVARALWKAISHFQKKTGVACAYQGCEHINRALVIERETADRFNLEPVSVIPHQKAGGSMAAYAFNQMRDPVVVEELKAHAGIDIGDTFIGMHLRKVAVPVRTSIKAIGCAHLTLARTRPKLIGGERAVYTRDLSDC